MLDASTARLRARVLVRDGGDGAMVVPQLSPREKSFLLSYRASSPINYSFTYSIVLAALHY
eukprot:scaffold63790_cov70-Phaeocystis_antarctica.AAC.4